jgi:hypothetical protein
MKVDCMDEMEAGLMKERGIIVHIMGRVWREES